MKKMTVVLDDDLYTAAKVEAARRNRPLKEIVAEALQEWLEVQEDLELGPLIDEARRELRDKGWYRGRGVLPPARGGAWQGASRIALSSPPLSGVNCEDYRRASGESSRLSWPALAKSPDHKGVARCRGR